MGFNLNAVVYKAINFLEHNRSAITRSQFLCSRRPIVRVGLKVIKRNPTFWARSLKTPIDVMFILIRTKFTVGMLSDMWERQKKNKCF